MNIRILLIAGVSLLAFASMAQNSTTQGIGFSAAQSTVTQGGKQIIYTFSSGSQVGASNGVKTITDASGKKVLIISGMPTMVQYFGNTFGTDVFASKGYFSSYVQLQWSVQSSSSIKRFFIYRKPLGDKGDSTFVATVPADTYNYQDQFAEKGTLYRYTIFAQGISDNLRIPYVNYVQSTGFVTAIGNASGKVTYASGTAVAGVSVSAETKGNLSGKGVSLNGTDGFLGLEHKTSDPELELRTGFTWQAWVRIDGTGKQGIFSKGANYSLFYEAGKLFYTVGNKTIQLTYNPPSKAYFHLTANYEPGKKMKLYALGANNKVDSVSADVGSQPDANFDNIWFGRSGTSYLTGYIDEVRLWQRILPFSEVLRDYGRYISGNETGIIGYWNMNAGIGDQFYDLARRGFTYYENHGFLNGAAWSNIIPGISQLSHRGITDNLGNYTISGFPYETAGSLYTFTPLFGVHKFEPSQQIRFVGDGATIQNEVNFKDVSSFKVTGTVRYNNRYGDTPFPVEGVSFAVDGFPVSDSTGNLIVSDKLGQFSIDVPIGQHTIKVSKNQHTFVNDGIFPGKGQPASLGNFQNPVSGIEFLDNTLVKVVGRVVGGPVQEAFPIGFNRSKNNLGAAKVTFTTEKGFPLLKDGSTPTSFTNSNERFNKATKVNFLAGLKTMEVIPNPQTGEYVAYLLPEKYSVTAVTAGTYTFDESFNKSLDLTSVSELSESVTDTLSAIYTSDKKPVAGYPNPSNAFPAASYDDGKTSKVTKNITETDSKGKQVQRQVEYTIGTATDKYKYKQNFIYREKPTISVVNPAGGITFGESTFKYNDLKLNTTSEIPLINKTDNTYSFDYPVFKQQSTYSMKVDVFEQYTNSSVNPATVDKVPVTDGSLEIVNAIAINSDVQSIPLDSRGSAVYTFKAGLPETNINPTEPSKSFTRTLTLTAVTGNNGALRTLWREADPFRAYVFGALPIGNNFVTTGPTKVTAILRDPPGSASSATLESGSTVFSSESWSSSANLNGSVEAAVSLGLKTEIVTGIGVAKVTEVEVTADLTLGTSFNNTWTSAGESTTTTSLTKTISTSSDPSYVGGGGDIFIGQATNIVYGSALNLTPLPSTRCNTCGEKEISVNSTGYKIGLENSLRLNPETATSFIYTQDYIENILIPNLQVLRNRLLIYPEPATYPADRVVYASKVNPKDTDAKKQANFGSNNDDKDAWATPSTNLQDGPSYKMVFPKTGPFTDSIRYYNSQIKEWKYWLGENEKRKVNAKLIENISFDAGTTYTNSKTVTAETSSTRDYSFQVDASQTRELGVEVDGIGVSASINLTTGSGGNTTTGSGSSNSTTYAYTFADSDAGDYMSVDVKDAKDGFGPVFYLKAGATQCPYEGAEETKYYLPKTRLGEATLAREKVSITVDNASVSNVPENRAAEFTLRLGNNSDTKEDAWYDLKVDDTTNPNGAVLEIDGLPIGNGRSFFVPAGQSLQKILKVRKGTAKILKYEGLKLNFGSQCDGSVNASVTVSAYFQAGCSDITFATPKNQWLVNTLTPSVVLSATINNYDLNYDNFKVIRFQYKSTASSEWITNYEYYHKVKGIDEYALNTSKNKGWIEGASLTHPFDMSSLPDRSFDIRAQAVCISSPGVEIITPTDILTGTKDVKRPGVFGSPQPGDGILSAGEDISVRFDEPIEAGLLLPSNFSVKGVLNGYKINNNTSVTLNGVDAYVRVPDGLSLSKSFTVEFWLQRKSLNKEVVVYSKGFAIQDAVQFGFTATNKAFVEVGTQRIESTNTITELVSATDTDGSKWHHYALAYNKAAKKISVYVDDKYAIDQTAVTQDIAGQGTLWLGKSVSENRFADINVHEFRVWSDFLTQAKVYAQIYTPLTGEEIGLVGYWPMDEAFGKNAFDKARSRHAMQTGDWLVLPKGKAKQFNGSEAMEINTASTVVISEDMDMTLEFWFNGVAGQKNVTLFSSGKGDGTDKFNGGNVSVNVNSNGKIQVLLNGQELLASGDKDNFIDNSWHHFALSLRRNALAILYIDGEQKASTPAAALGGLSGLKMYVGARGYKPNAVADAKDQFFKGQLDELRIWKLARRQNQILLDRNARLLGNEGGLVAYYPFERYQTFSGIKSLTETVADQWSNPFGANGGKAKGDTILTNNSPNIKDARPVTNVDFTWAVNSDEIIITPSAAISAQIEKAVIEVTVGGVEDKFGNTLLSPVTWTAFADRNPVKWDNDNLDFSKKLFDKQTFTVKVVNKGGTQQNYSIKNLPAWLTAQPQSGSLAPQSTATITFTVNEGLNTGYFNEDIFLAGDFGYNEKLQLTLRVFTPEPAWSVDASKFQYSMNVIGQLRINEVISTDFYDRVAVFVNGECRGVTNLKYISQFDQYQAYLDVYSNVESGEALEFRVWDASKGTEYRDVTPNSYTFLSNSLKGSPSTPEIISAGASALQIVNLEAGWNWKSFNVKSDQLANPTNLLKGLNTVTGDIIKGQTSVDVFAPGAGWSGTITSTGGFKNGQLYLMKVSNVGNFEVKGTLLEPTFPIPLKTGWNWIGFVPQFNVSVNEALASWQASNGDIVKGKRAFATYQDGLGWIGSLTFMLPGEGYLVRTAKDATLVYPEITSLSAGGRVQLAEDTKQYWPVDAGKAQNNMSMIAKLETDQKDEWVVGAFSGQVCKGFATPASITGEKTLYFLTVHGDQTENMQLKALNKNTGEVRLVKQVLSFAPNDAKGTFESPIVLTFDEEKGSTGSELFAYPNPVTDILTVILPQDGQAHNVFFTDLTGRVLRKVEAPENTTKVEISLKEDIATGVYILSVEGGSLMKTVKIVKN
jgi:hypothetical protein